MYRLFRFSKSEKMFNPCKIKFLGFDLNYKAIFPASIYKIWYIVLLVAIFIPSPFKIITHSAVQQVRHELNDSDFVFIESAGKDFVDVRSPFARKIFIIKAPKFWNKGSMELGCSLVELLSTVSAYGETVGNQNPQQGSKRTDKQGDDVGFIHFIIGFIVGSMCTALATIVYLKLTQY